MSIFAEMHDGTRLEFPDGTKPEVMQAVVKRRLSGTDHQVSSPAESPGIVSQGIAQGRDALLAAGHHAMNLPHGIAQGVENVVNYGAQALPDNPVSRAINSTVQADNEAMAQRERDYQASVPNSAGAYTGAVAGEVLPFAATAVAAPLKAGGTLLERFLAKHTGSNIAGKIGSGVGQGVAIGAAAPVTEGDYGTTKAHQMEMGAVVGGSVPVVAKALGGGYELGRRVVNPMFNPETSAIEKLVQDAGGIENAKAAIDKAVSAGKTISGESYTLGQAGKNAGLSSTERARSAVNPENFQAIYQAQREARLSALQGIGKDDIAVQQAISDRAASTQDLYAGVQDKVFTGGDDLQKLLSRNRAMGTLQEAQALAAGEGRTFSIPLTEEAATTPQTLQDIERQYANRATHPDYVLGEVSGYPSGQSSLLADIRRLGGVSTRDMADLVGERATNKSGAQVGVFTKNGEEVGDMVRRLVDKGTLPKSALNDVDGGAQYLRDEIQKALNPQHDPNLAKFGPQSAEDILPGSYKEGVSAAPQQVLQEVVGQAIKGGDLQSVKMGIDQALSTATGPRKAVLMKLKTDFLKWMGEQSPEYLKANALYAEKSRPINQMRVAQRLTDALTGKDYKYGAEPKQLASSFYTAMKNAPAIAKQEGGMRQPLNKIFEKDQLETINKVAREVAKDVDLQTLGRGAGSDTAQKLARGDVAGNMLSDLVHSNKYTSAAASVAGGAAKYRVNKQLDMMLQNPELAKAAIEKLTKPEQNSLAKFLQINAMTNQLFQSTKNSP